jgi:hypothetical protein
MLIFVSNFAEEIKKNKKNKKIFKKSIDNDLGL